ncbi:MAG: adenylosuccinate synthase [bacterium]|nr:adenylosuccinate synthase [bacterium]
MVGLTWGDEGKGKVIDLLCSRFDEVVRYNGGANAGHTVWVGEQRFALHLVPTGILRPRATAVIGPGVALDPLVLLDEISELRSRGVRVADNLKISDRAHVVTVYHKLEDALGESQAGGGGRIGTTSRGIGPCYADKMRRYAAVRVCDLLDERRLAQLVGSIVPLKRRQFTALYGTDGGLNAEGVLEELAIAAAELRPHVCDTGAYVRGRIASGAKVLFEGANGVMLDIDHGTYPYVTSSSTGPHGVPGGAGVPAATVRDVVGVTKAYTTRVGEGPLVSELPGEDGDRIRERGREYGTTTGRPRRCGWLDAVALRYAAELVGATELAMMHLDTLSGFEKVGICIAYEIDGHPVDTVLADASLLERAAPVIEYCPGWSEEIRGIRDYQELPAAAQAYVARIESLSGCPVTLIGTGPGRSECICRGRREGLATADQGGEAHA